MKPTMSSNVCILKFMVSGKTILTNKQHYFEHLILGGHPVLAPPTVPSQEAHVQTLNSLDAARLNLVKSINDAEGSLAGKEDALARLKEECSKLEASDPATEHELDATT